jgi:membrane-bound lytic murein transglycosylase A
MRGMMMRAKLLFGFIFILLVAFISGCGPSGFKGPKDTPLNPLIKLSPGHYPKFLDSLGFEGLNRSIEESLIYFKRVPLSRKYTYGKEIFDAGHMIRSMEIFQAFLAENPTSDQLNAVIKNHFLVYKSVGNDKGEVLFTGYYEPTYKGSLEQDETYIYPVYSKPLDLLQIDLSLFSDKYKGHKRLTARVNPSTRRVVPYYSRKEINRLSDFVERAVPVVWLENRVDRFFLEIQGSGRVELKQGGMRNVHYAASNGNAYRSVGRYLINKNEIAKEDMSMQAIRQWLEKNPNRMDEVLNHNGSFVFFKAGEGGPFGSINVQVTPLRSIATDLGIFPRGALCFAEAALPDPKKIESQKKGDKGQSDNGQSYQDKSDQDKWDKVSIFVLNQDTGGAIRGPARGDLFCGNGDYAEFTAGHMNTYGQLYFLVLKP